MIVDHFVDLAQSGPAEFSGWRCLLCGNITDSVIAANQQQPPALKTPLPKRPLAA
jgi:hypothetical protein